MHKLLDAMEAVKAGDYELVPGRGSRTRSMTVRVEYAARVKGIYLNTNFHKETYDKEASDGWMHRQMPSCLLDSLQGRFYGIEGAFVHGKLMWDKSSWLQCSAVSFCKVVMDGSLAEDFEQLLDTFGARPTAHYRNFPCVRYGREAHTVTLINVNFTLSDAVLFKLAHFVVG